MRKHRVEGSVPSHIAIIMDGNGRWAKQRLLPRLAGHKQGVERMLGLVRHAFSLGVSHVTLYALSAENLLRPKQEVEGLFALLREYLEKYKREENLKFRFYALGDLSLLPPDVEKLLREIEKKTAAIGEKQVNLAVGYGSRQEILRAVNLAVERGEQVSDESFSKLLYTKDIPPLDLIIRTGREKRLSNFLLYQAAYAELYFSDKMFPEFSNGDLEEAFTEYASRVRRFGKIDEQLTKN